MRRATQSTRAVVLMPDKEKSQLADPQLNDNGSVSSGEQKVGLLQMRIIWDLEMQAKLRGFLEAMAETVISSI